MPHLTHVSKFLHHYYKLQCNIIVQCDDVANEIITCAHVASHVTFLVKK